MNIFSEIPVAIPLFIASQVAGFVAFIIAIIGHSSKHRERTFSCFGIANTLIAISAAILLNWVFAILSISAAMRNFTFYFIEKRKLKGKAPPHWVLAVVAIVFIIMVIVPTIFIWQWWVDWMIVIAAILVIIISLTKSAVLLRIPFIMADTFITINHIKFFNIIGAVQSSTFITIAIIFLIRHTGKKRKKPEAKENRSVIV